MNSKYIHKLDSIVVEAKQIVRKFTNELHFNTGELEPYPEGSYLLAHSNVGDWVIQYPTGDTRLLSAADFNKQYENYFEHV